MKRLLSVIVFTSLMMMNSLVVSASNLSYSLVNNFGEASPGETYTLESVVHNLSETDPMSVDFTIESNISTRDFETVMPVEWVTIAPVSVDDLAPGDSRTVNIAVEIPEDTEPSTYRIAIMAKSDSVDGSDVSEETTGASMSATVGAKVSLTVVEKDGDAVSAEGDDSEASSSKASSGDSAEGEESETSFSYEFYFDLLLLVLIILMFAKLHSLEESMAAGKKKSKK